MGAVTCDGQPPLPLTLTGMCVDATAEPTTLSFKTRVREPSAQSITIKNGTANLWRITPTLSNDAWQGAEVLEVPAGQSASYEVVYVPMVMTAEGEKHEGTAFFALPDGSAIMHTLEGVAEPPMEAGTVAEQLPCKRTHLVPLAVKNWLKVPQRFRVEIRAPDKDASTELTGHEYVDVPASQSRDYSLSYFAYKEGVTNLEVHFLNEKSGEFLFYKLALTGTAAGALERIEMQAPLRQLSRHLLPLRNPLEAEVSFTASVDRADVTVPASLVVPAGGRAELPIEWRPLLPQDGTATLTLQSAELGAFVYELALTALPAGNDKSLGFKVSLGEAQTLRFRFVNFLRRPETYKLALAAAGESDFAVEASVRAPASPSPNPKRAR